MKKIVRLTESDLIRLVKRVIIEQTGENTITVTFPLITTQVACKSTYKVINPSTNPPIDIIENSNAEGFTANISGKLTLTITFPSLPNTPENQKMIGKINDFKKNAQDPENIRDRFMETIRSSPGTYGGVAIKDLNKLKSAFPGAEITGTLNIDYNLTSMSSYLRTTGTPPCIGIEDTVTPDNVIDYSGWQSGKRPIKESYLRRKKWF